MLTPKSHPLQWRHTGVMASQITGNTTICSTAFFSLTTKETLKARIIGTLLCWPVDSPPKGPVTQKTLSRHNDNMFHLSCHRGVGLPQLNLQFKFKFSSIGNRKWNHSLLIGCRPDETVLFEACVSYRSLRCNYANPVYGVAAICHQVRWLRWGHPSLFHTATSLLI